MKQKQHIPFRIRLVFLTRNWIWLFWLLLLPVVWIMLPLERLSNPIAGYVSSETENVGPFAISRIRSLYVKVGQQVEPGDILAEVESLADEKQGQDIFSLEIRTRQALEDTRVSLAKTRMDQARDRASLEGLVQELAHLEPMVKQGLISDIELTKIRPQITALTETLDSYPPLINTLNARLVTAEAELRQIEQYIESQQLMFTGARDTDSTVSRLEYGQVSYITAKSGGIVSHIQYNVGDIVPSGTPIIRVASLSTIMVTGILRPYQIELVREGMTLTVVPPYRSVYKQYPAKIISIEPEILNLPDPFISVSKSLYPSRGLRMILTIDDVNHDFIPGENVYIFLPSPTLLQKFNRFIGQIRWNINEKTTLWE